VLKARTRISTAGGVRPVWAKNGRTLFYRNGQAIMAFEVRGATPKEWGAPERLFEGPYFFIDGPPMFDVAPDGRFLMLKEVRSNPEPNRLRRLIVVENWTEELKQRVPTR
jgi:hypothetical protein